jgi:hypothetical protein
LRSDFFAALRLCEQKEERDKKKKQEARNNKQESADR